MHRIPYFPCFFSLQKGSDSMTGPPKPLHLTKSVYIRHLPPRIAAQDIVEV